MTTSASYRGSIKAGGAIIGHCAAGGVAQLRGNSESSDCEVVVLKWLVPGADLATTGVPQRRHVPH